MEDLPFSVVTVISLSPPDLTLVLANKHWVCLNSELISTAISGGERWCFQEDGSNLFWQQGISVS